MNVALYGPLHEDVDVAHHRVVSALQQLAESLPPAVERSSLETQGCLVQES